MHRSQEVQARSVGAVLEKTERVGRKNHTEVFSKIKNHSQTNTVQRLVRKHDRGLKGRKNQNYLTMSMKYKCIDLGF